MMNDVGLSTLERHLLEGRFRKPILRRRRLRYCGHEEEQLLWQCEGSAVIGYPSRNMGQAYRNWRCALDYCLTVMGVE